VKGADVEPNCIRLEITCQGLRAGLQGRETCLPDIVYEGGAEFGREKWRQWQQQ